MQPKLPATSQTKSKRADMAEEIILVGQQTSEIKIAISPGSKPGFICAACAADVTLAPTGQKFLASNAGVIIRCNRCIPNEALREAEIQIPPGAAKEIADWMVSRQNWERRN